MDNTMSAMMALEIDRSLYRSIEKKESEVVPEAEKTLRDMEEIYYENIERVIPIDSGDMWGSVETTWIGLSFEIEPKAEYSKWVVSGHATMVSERQRRWWFWYLNTVLGGDYDRKTDGEPGTVPPTPFMETAINSAEPEVAYAFERYMAWLGMDIS